ncbi:YOR1 Oligomycin resistance ATP-dependent permease YOR1 [Candida maltosa Xu316]
MDDVASLEFGNDIYRPQKRLLTFLFNKDKTYPIPRDDERKPYPESASNWISRIFFWWLTPVMKVGYRRTLQPNDLWTLTDEMKVENLSTAFYTYLDLEATAARVKHIEAKCKERGETQETSTVDPETDLEDFVLSAKSVAIAIFLTFKRELIISIVIAAFALCGLALTPLLNKYLITYVQNRTLGIESNVGKGIGYSFGVALLMAVTGLLVNHFFYIAQKIGGETKALLTNAILDKSFKLDAKGKHQFPTGKITSFITTDLSRIEIAAIFQPLLICIPLPIIIAIVILVVNIRVSAVIGIVIFLFFLCFIGFGAAKLITYRDIVSKITDRRVSLIKEILNNLKMIKYYSWEHPYHQKLTQVRNEEMDVIFKIQTLRNVVFSLAMTLIGLCTMIAFIILYALDGKTSSPAKIFSSVSSFGIMGMMIMFIPQALSTTTDMFLGFKRIGSLLSATEELENENYRVNTDGKNDDDGIAVAVNKAKFSWEKFSEEDDLEATKKKKKKKLSRKEKKKKAERIKKRKELLLEKEQREKDLKLLGLNESSSTFQSLSIPELSIKKGEFVVVTGAIGSGKSSLLNAISGFMKFDSGEIDINGSLLLCGAPWIQNNTIRENITFGLEYDQSYYQKVIYACALHIDLDNLEGGDFTEVGERGITLSGGQKARINLARAVYADKDIILLDDPLSAVDSKVGKHIMKNCLMGLLKDKTRILATHQLNLIGSADRIIFLNGDGSIDVGEMDELLSRNDGFAKLMDHSKLESTEADVIDKLDIDSPEGPSDDEKHHEEDEDEKFVEYNKNKDARKGKIQTDEERAVNRIKGEVYWTYIKQGSGKLTAYGSIPLFLLLLALSTFCEIFTNTWLSFWISNKFPHLSNGGYIGVYVLLNVMWTILLTVTFVYFIHIIMTSSKNLQLMSISKILYTTMSFMDTTPMGRIMNRFTKDTDVTDNEISENLRFFLTTTAQIIGVLILFIIYIPWFAIALPFIFFVFFLVAHFYQASNREVKRLEAIQRSFVYNNVNEILGGMNTIKAYSDQKRFMEISNRYLDRANEATFVVYANQRWIGIQLDLLADVIVLIVGLLTTNKVFSLSPASAGLLMTYSMTISGDMSNLIRTFTQAENDFNSVERITHYATKLAQEAPYSISANQPPASWPDRGEIVFDKVKLRYRPGLPLVLKNLSFSVAPGQKIGICGRTGAGKSSIMTALYRLSELDGGKITIDNIDISTIGLKDLRSKLSIIPQDPALFSGTIRSNIDPFQEHPDEVLWTTLKRAGILTSEELDNAKKVSDSSTVKFHLDNTVEDEGANFSLGERQLIAFARALVRGSKILVLDEATSSVDYHTDAKIQETIAREFGDCTILTIAHRLKTIINYDKILVLDAGEVQEYDTPLNLFESDGIFRSMCEKSNITRSDFHV